MALSSTKLFACLGALICSFGSLASDRLFDPTELNFPVVLASGHPHKDPSSLSLLPRQEVQDGWIWPSDGHFQGPDGSLIAHRTDAAGIAVRRFYTTPASRAAPKFVTCQIAATDHAELFVNGVSYSQVCGGDPPQKVHVPLHPFLNLFAARVYNVVGDPVAGFFLSCSATLSDGSLHTFETDHQWSSANATLANMEGLEFLPDPTVWKPARFVGQYGTLPTDDVGGLPAFPHFPNFSAASWIWTTNVGVDNYPVGQGAFRWTFVHPNKKEPRFASVLITADDTFMIWVNGILIDASLRDTWGVARRFVVDLTGKSTVFAVYASNVNVSPAGLLVSLVIHYSDGTWDDTFGSNSTWKTYPSKGTLPPDNFFEATFDDSAWLPAFERCQYLKSCPWGEISLPQY